MVEKQSESESEKEGEGKWREREERGKGGIKFHIGFTLSSDLSFYVFNHQLRRLESNVLSEKLLTQSSVWASYCMATR